MTYIEPYDFQKSTAFKERMEIINKINEVINFINKDDKKISKFDSKWDIIDVDGFLDKNIIVCFDYRKSVQIGSTSKILYFNKMYSSLKGTRLSDVRFKDIDIGYMPTYTYFIEYYINLNNVFDENDSITVRINKHYIYSDRNETDYEDITIPKTSIQIYIIGD